MFVVWVLDTWIQTRAVRKGLVVVVFPWRREGRRSGMEVGGQALDVCLLENSVWGLRVYLRTSEAALRAGRRVGMSTCHRPAAGWCTAPGQQRAVHGLVGAGAHVGSSDDRRQVALMDLLLPAAQFPSPAPRRCCPQSGPAAQGRLLGAALHAARPHRRRLPARHRGYAGGGLRGRWGGGGWGLGGRTTHEVHQSTRSAMRRTERTNPAQPSTRPLRKMSRGGSATACGLGAMQWHAGSSKSYTARVYCGRIGEYRKAPRRRPIGCRAGAWGHAVNGPRRRTIASQGCEGGVPVPVGLHGDGVALPGLSIPEGLCDCICPDCALRHWPAAFLARQAGAAPRPRAGCARSWPSGGTSTCTNRWGNHRAVQVKV